jgi:hypothetical protein
MWDMGTNHASRFVTRPSSSALEEDERGLHARTHARTHLEWRERRGRTMHGRDVYARDDAPGELVGGWEGNVVCVIRSGSFRTCMRGWAAAAAADGDEQVKAR